jgi:siroheme synthase-like protein
MLEGRSLRALVVGGGPVAVRKIRALLASGASVRVVAPEVDPALDEALGAGLQVERRPYATDDIADALLVIAATSSRDVNAQVGRDARTRGRLVIVSDAPEEGNCTSPATHRTGDLVIAVSAGGVPAAAARVRDSLADRYAQPYADAISELSDVRSRLLRAGDREGWRRVIDTVIDEDFCDAVERGELTQRVAAWR